MRPGNRPHPTPSPKIQECAFLDRTETGMLIYDMTLNRWVHVAPKMPTGHSRWTDKGWVHCPPECPRTAPH